MQRALPSKVLLTPFRITTSDALKYSRLTQKRPEGEGAGMLALLAQLQTGMR